ncbi:hypothetical protein LPJ81_006841, partial [Coemansia sp. IMI 209127]
MLRPNDPPWWAAAAFWALGAHLAKLKLHPTDLLKVKPPRSPYGSRPDFWKHVLKSWKQTKGNLPSDIGPASIQAMVGAPLEHPAISSRYTPPVAQQSVLRSNGLHTLSDVFIRNPLTGAAITPAGPRVKPFVTAVSKFNIILQPTITRQLLNFPEVPDKRAVWAEARIGGVSLEEYRPRHGRLVSQSRETKDVKWQRWECERNESSDPATREQVKSSRWARINKVPLEPKYTSLMWLMAHGAVPTARQLTHCVPDLSPFCILCDGEVESISHYFWKCPRAQRYWLLISDFLQSIRRDQPVPAVQVSLTNVIDGFGEWRNSIPNADAIH